MLSLRNRRTGASLAVGLQTAHSFWRKGIGLLGEAGLPAGEGLYIEPCNSIHSLFMRFPFDAVFVDKRWRVVHLIHEMKAFRVSPVVWKAHGVVELPAGTARRTDTMVGDQLELVADAG